MQSNGHVDSFLGSYYPFSHTPGRRKIALNEMKLISQGTIFHFHEGGRVLKMIPDLFSEIMEVGCTLNHVLFGTTFGTEKVGETTGWALSRSL